METAFFPSVSESKTIPFVEQRGLCGGGCWAGPTRSTGHHLHCVALSPGHEIGTSSPRQLPRHSPAYHYPGGWVSPQVLNIHNYLVSEASFLLLNLYMPQIPEGDTFS